MPISSHVRRSSRAAAVAVAALITSTTRPLAAQIVASERAMIAQTVDGTRITVDYSRPRMRGRTNIYGGLEKWGTTWTPGADDATTLEVSKPVTVAGMRVPKGRYSVWFVLREQSPWTLVLDPRDSLFHTDHPDSTAAQLRTPIVPQDVATTEVLTWGFPAVTNRGATLEFRWGTKGVALPIEVPATLPFTVAAREVAPFLGDYTFTWADTSANAPKPSRFTVQLRGDQLFGVWDPPPYGTMREMQLLSNGPDRFAYGWYRDGSLWASNGDLNIEFERRDGVVTGFTYRAKTDLIARGVRRP